MNGRRPPDSAITFAIPFYAGSAYLESAIRSVLSQTRSDWSLVVCDDCGPATGTEDLMRSFGDPRIRYQRNERNLGLAGNWNRCLDTAPTDLVTILHEDDELLPTYLATLAGAAARFPAAAALFCQAKIINAAGRPAFSFPDFFKRFLVPSRKTILRLHGESSLEALLRGNFVMCPTLCYRKSLLGGARFNPAWKFAPDMELIARLLLEERYIIGLPEVEYAYRRHGQSTTAKLTESLDRFREEAELYEALKARALERGWPRAALKAEGKLIVKLNLLYCAARDLLGLRLHPAWQKLRFLLGQIR